MQIRSAAVTDIGKVRRYNEDRYLLDGKLNLYGVADGVGGLPGGAEASQSAVDTVLRLMNRTGEVLPDLAAITLEANQVVAQLGYRLSPHFGIGSTLTFGVFADGKLHLAHVGDSRCYLVRKGGLECLTMDHSVENEARARRARGEFMWVNEQHRHALTRCIGQTTPLEVDVSTFPVEIGDRYLFTTDGITRMVRDDELLENLSQQVEPEEIIRNLVKLANGRGGLDNATAVLVQIDPES